MDLLQLWQSIYQEVVQLAEIVQRLPDNCECGDADAHLEERCMCCDGHKRAKQPRDGGQNCSTILANLRVNLAMLCKDFTTVAEPIGASALVNHQLELRRGVFLAASDLQQLLEEFEQASAVVAGFRRSCAISEMNRVKHHCAQLRERCEKISAQLHGA
ncbi:MAG: hypothetical protein AB1489_31875 [Acidobacteriota bacterium]